MTGTVAQLQHLRDILEQPLSRQDRGQRIADAIRAEGDYRWVGLYDVDEARGSVSNIAWSGPQGPAHPVFSTSEGITSRVIALRHAVNIGDVRQDPDYLTALNGTRSELIVPVLHQGRVVGTIDVESQYPNDFGATAQRYLQYCAGALVGFWVS